MKGVTQDSPSSASAPAPASANSSLRSQSASRKATKSDASKRKSHKKPSRDARKDLFNSVGRVKHRSKASKRSSHKSKSRRSKKRSNKSRKRSTSAVGSYAPAGSDVDEASYAYMICAKVAVSLLCLVQAFFVCYVFIGFILIEKSLPVSTGLLVSMLHLIVISLSVEIVVYSTKQLCLFVMASDLCCVLTSFLYIAIKESAEREPGYSTMQSLELLRNSVVVTAESCLLLVTNLCLMVTLYSEIKAAGKTKEYTVNNIGVSLHKYDIEYGAPRQPAVKSKRGPIGKLVAYGADSIGMGAAKKEDVEAPKDNSGSCRRKPATAPESSCKTAQPASGGLGELSARQKTSSPPKTAIVIPSTISAPTTSSGAQSPLQSLQQPAMQYVFDQPQPLAPPPTPKK